LQLSISFPPNLLSEFEISFCLAMH
jgi:hypothetical protein